MVISHRKKYRAQKNLWLRELKKTAKDIDDKSSRIQFMIVVSGITTIFKQTTGI